MNKFILNGICALVAMAGIAVAGSVYDRATVSTDVNGLGSYEYDAPYRAIKLTRIWTVAALASNDVAVKRVTADGLYTQVVGTVIGPVGGNISSFSAGYLLPGDSLTFVTTPGTATVFQIEYEVQTH